MKKSSKRSVNSVPKIEKHHRHFLALLVLFAGFSIYAIMSFFSSTERYLNSAQVSVTAEINEDVSMPPECQTCADSSMNTAMTEPVFIDVPLTHPNAEAVSVLYLDGLINGYSDGTFQPDAFINRAELLTILTNATDADLSGNYGNCFNDVAQEWFAPFVCYAKVHGWVSGYEDGSFKPSQAIIKAEALKIVLTAFAFEMPSSITVVPYPDVLVSEWYAIYAQVGRERGVVDAFGNFDAAHQMSRGEIAQMIYNAKY